MFIPYSTDEHDGKIGIVSVAIVLVCLLVHIVISVHDRSVRMEIMELERELTSLTRSEDHLGRVLSEKMKKAAGDTDQDPEYEAYKQRMKKRVDSVVARAKELQNEMWLSRLAFVPEKKNLLSALFSMFTHAGWMHLIGNMLFFYVAGVVMEKYWGHLRFLLVYLACGLVAVLFHILHGYLLASGSEWASRPLVGASGAIAGAMGALTVVFPKSRVHIFYWIFRFMGTFKMKVLYYLGFWIASQVFYIILDPGMNSATAFSAHVGGFFGGALFGLFLKGNELNLENQTRPKRGGKASGFVMLSSDGQSISEPTRNNELKEPEVSVPEVVQGWIALEKGRIEEASAKIVRGIDFLFTDPVENRSEISDNIHRFANTWRQLSFSGTHVYQWGKKLQEMNLGICALLCYDIAFQADAPGHVKINSLFTAASLRIGMHHEIDRAQRDLLWIIKVAPDSIPAREARGLLNSLQL
ncbi:MAG: rhomboid family intramembrane serine protease [Chitinispirillaceae bacterium]